MGWWSFSQFIYFNGVQLQVFKMVNYSMAMYKILFINWRSFVCKVGSSGWFHPFSCSSFSTWYPFNVRAYMNLPWAREIGEHDTRSSGFIIPFYVFVKKDDRFIVLAMKMSFNAKRVLFQMLFFFIQFAQRESGVKFVFSRVWSIQVNLDETWLFEQWEEKKRCGSW